MVIFFSLSSTVFPTGWKSVPEARRLPLPWALRIGSVIALSRLTRKILPRRVWRLSEVTAGRPALTTAWSAITLPKRKRMTAAGRGTDFLSDMWDGKGRA